MWVCVVKALESVVVDDCVSVQFSALHLLTCVCLTKDTKRRFSSQCGSLPSHQSHFTQTHSSCVWHVVDHRCYVVCICLCVLVFGDSGGSLEFSGGVLRLRDGGCWRKTHDRFHIDEDRWMSVEVKGLHSRWAPGQTGLHLFTAKKQQPISLIHIPETINVEPWIAYLLRFQLWVDLPILFSWFRSMTGTCCQ